MAAASMVWTRVYSDSNGESHFEESVLELTEVDFAPPAPPLLLSNFTDATSYGFLSAPPDWFGDWHPTPQRQAMLVMSGEVEITVSDGETRRFGPGKMCVLEDVTGKGHATRVVGREQLLVGVVQMPE